MMDISLIYIDNNKNKFMNDYFRKERKKETKRKPQAKTKTKIMPIITNM